MKDYKKNHTKAWCYFVAIGKIPPDARKNEWCLHHKDTELKYTDPDRYNEWCIEDLEPMLKADHTAFHQNNHKVSEATKQKISNVLKGHEVTEETRQKISSRCKGLHNGKEFQKGDTPWNKGKKMSEEFCQKMSELHKGKPLSEEHRRNISASNTGKHMSDEAKAKISEALKGHEVTEETRQKMRTAVRKPYAKHSEEHNKKIGSWKRGKIWVNNGSIMKMVDKDNIPEGFTKGRLK